MSDKVMSDESNDMTVNIPDIEEIEVKREIKLAMKDFKNEVKAQKKLAMEDFKIVSIPEFMKNEVKTNETTSDHTLSVSDLEKINRQKQEKIRLKKEKAAMLEKIRMEQRLKKIEDKKIAEEEALEKRREKALKGMKYLLGLSEKYITFFKDKILDDAPPASKKGILVEKNKYQPTVQDMKEIKTSDVRKSKSEQTSSDVTKQLKYFEGGSLRPYQIEGVAWMLKLFQNGLNGILADEMGLGKTIQVIALVCNLLEKEIEGPFLIVAPLSTLRNWQSEFKRFAPQVPVVVFQGSAVERIQQYKELKRKYPIGNFRTSPVIITSYQMPLMEFNFFKTFVYQFIIIDEGHRIKNHQTKLSVNLRNLNSNNRLLLTGTPLQNNITELWALLNFLLPHIFNNMDTFSALFVLEEIQDGGKLLQQEQKTNMISTIHKVLAPFMLRRLKNDVLKDTVPKKEVTVYCPLSKLQRDLYQYVITRNLKKLFKVDEEEEFKLLNGPRPKRKCTLNHKYFHEPEEDDLSDEEDKVEEFVQQEAKETGDVKKKEMAQFAIRLTMGNVMDMFKKIVNHPYLVHFPLNPNSEKRELLVDENLIKSSGKLMVLDAMLPKLRERGHRVLLFSTLVMTLDMVEEFLIMRNYTYTRLDGCQSLDVRAENIDEFNQDPNLFIFLISTRAGGLGLNLTGADTVIFFDRDWNPQADIQAQDRCHRIGQTKPVVVYTLITKNTIDEKIMHCGHIKRRLEKIVIKDGKFKSLTGDDRRTEREVLEELQELLNKEHAEENNFTFSNLELDRLLDRSDLYEIMSQSKEN